MPGPLAHRRRRRALARSVFVASSAAAGRGFTLLELVLVLALLALLGALVVPALEAPFAAERLVRSADQLRGAWARARLDAMTSGEARSFSFQPQTGTYRVERYASLEGELETATLVVPGAEGARVWGAEDASLPEGIALIEAGVAADSRATQLAAGGGQTLAGGWSTPILFFPDGSTSTAEVLLQNESQRCVIVSLRGLTGISGRSAVFSQEAISP